VGAADLRPAAEEVPVAIRAGLDLVLDRPLPLASAVSAHAMELELAAPQAAEGGGAAPRLDQFFDNGRSLVAGRAALIHGGDDPELAVEHAASAGASAVVVYGTQLPAGGLGLDESVGVPVVSVPPGVAQAALAAIRRHERPTISIGVPKVVHNGGHGEIAPFSSRGLAFDGRVKPDLAAPGVAVPTAEPGTNNAGAPRVGTVNGSSPAAAVVAGAAAALAQARPGLRALDLKSLLTAAAKPIAHTSVTAQGSGLVDLGAAVAGEISVEPTTLAFGRAQGDGWHSTQVLVVHNVSTRRLLVRIHPAGSGGLVITPKPRWTRLKPGGRTLVRLSARLQGAPPSGGSAEGAVVLVPRGTGPLRIPWAITFGRPPRSLISAVGLSSTAFKPSDTTPAVLSLRAGLVSQSPVGTQVVPVAKLDVELWRGRNTLGLLARLRDLLPGRVVIGLTGRGPDGTLLPPGRYRIQLVADPTGPGPPTSRTIGFRIR
jgi:hypothetical protein